MSISHTATTPMALVGEDADQQVQDATHRRDALTVQYAAAALAADGVGMWACRQQLAQASGELDELRAAATIRRQHAVVAALEVKLTEAERAVEDARAAVEDAAAANLAAGGLLFDLRRAHTVAAAQLGALARDVTAAQAEAQAAERPLKTLIAETARRIG